MSGGYLDRFTTPEERRRIVSALLTFAVLVGLAALFLVVVTPGLRGRLAPEPDVPVSPAARSGWLDPTDFPPARGYVIPAVDPALLVGGSPGLLERGRELYARQCAACHGAEGRGDGPAAGSLNPRPRDLTDPAGWKNGPGLAGIFATLESGIAGSAMAAFDTLTKADRMALAHAVRALSPGAPADPPEALAALSARLAGAAEAVPPRIPLAMAVERLAAEAAAAGEAGRSGFAGEALGALGPAASDAVLDPGRAERALRAADAWRESPEALARFAALGAPANGFSPAASTFTADAWRALHAALAPLVPPRK